MSLTEVAQGVWTTTARTWSTLSTVVVATDGRCLVVDPALTVAEVRGLAAEIRERGWRPVAGFSTHPHWDHVLWTDDLGAIPRWATPAAVRTSVAHRADILAESRADAPGHDPRIIGRLTPLLADAGNVPWDGPRAVVVPYRAHCLGSAALVLPEVGVLIAGDLVSDREVPLLDLDAADPIGDHQTALQRLEQAAERHRVRVVIPGHGTVTDADGLQARLAADRAYLAGLVSGGCCDDPRLDDPWVAGEHDRQSLWARGGRPVDA
jgi:glyoxylase-like metal-dependent hydrolase (beta-lactamase superfamily II)